MKIEAKKLTKNFPLRTSDYPRAAYHILRGRSGRLSKQSFTAVKDVSLNIHEGERVGIIGRNGAGKTTLLRMIAGLASPTGGTVNVNGQIHCLLTMGLGLREELSGRENILTDGEFRGLQRSEMSTVTDEIIEFADIGEFIDLPVRTYSSGMKARLAFAMMMWISPEILMIDEVFSVGDIQFSQKASKKMKQLCEKGKILLVASHSMSTITELCNRCLWLEAGKIRMDGDPEEVTEAYLQTVRREDEALMQEMFKKRVGSRSLDEGCRIDQLDLTDHFDESKVIYYVGEINKVRFVLNCKGPVRSLDVCLKIERTDGIVLLERKASEDGFELVSAPGRVIYEILLDDLRMGRHTYEVTIEVLEKQTSHARVIARRSVILQIRDRAYSFDQPAIWTSAEWKFDFERCPVS